jgi:hypothetical protein
MSEAFLDGIKRDRSLNDPARLRERLEVLDRLELCQLDADGQPRADVFRERFEAINDALYRKLRDAIREGNGAQALTPWLNVRVDDEAMSIDGYDWLDELVSGVFPIEPPDDAQVTQPDNMVFYQPTPARHVFDLIRRAQLNADDVLIDLGAGLGHVPLLAAICTPATCVGIEREQAYAESFRRSAHALNLSRAICIQQDAREADFSSGTLFYLYTPFTGDVMRSVLDHLRRETTGRPISIATYGPCTSVIGEEPWLEVLGRLDVHRITLFRSR